MTGWKLWLVMGVLALSLLGNALTAGALLRLREARTAMLGDSADVTLPRDLRRDLARTLWDSRATLAPAIKAVQDARRDAVLAVMAKPYDAAKAKAALDGLRSSVGALMEQGEAVVLDRLARR